MLKRSNLILGILGILAIIGGILFTPALIARIAHHGEPISLEGTIWIYLFQLFFLLTGIYIVLFSIVFSFLSEEKKRKYYLLGISFLGVVVAIIGIISSPYYFQKKLMNIKVIDVFAIYSLYNLQLIILTLGCLIFLISFLIYIYKFEKAKKTWLLISIPVILIIYCSLVYTTYLSKKYPYNILLKINSFGKVYDLLIGRDILLSEYDPQIQLKLHRNHVVKAKYPVIDIHFHFRSDFVTKEDLIQLNPDSLIKVMDSVGIKMIVGNDGKDIENLLKIYHDRYPDKFLNFTTLMVHSWPYPDDYMASLPERLEKLVKEGLSGIGEFPKELGLKIKDTNGKRISTDDARLAPLFEKAGELGIPIVWHVADPIQFFQPIDRHNERFIQLVRYPDWSYYGPEFPTRATLFKERENVVREHPHTIFIMAHLGMCPDDFDYLGHLFDTYPNLYAEISSSLSDVGREPYTARKFFIKYKDRILFGTDGGAFIGVKGWTLEKYYQSYFDFLETDDELIDYPAQEAVNQGDWKIYGINLPDSVLKKIYYENAEKILFPNSNKK